MAPGTNAFGPQGMDATLQYQSDYILRLIEQMGDLIRRATQALQQDGGEEPYELAQDAIGLAIDFDPALLARLAPQSLASLVEMSNLDNRVIELVARALEIQAEALEQSGELVSAENSRQQSLAVLGLLDPHRAN